MPSIEPPLPSVEHAPGNAPQLDLPPSPGDEMISVPTIAETLVSTTVTGGAPPTLL